MALVISGNVVSLDRYSVLGESVTGRVWIDDGGVVVAVTSGGCREPAGFEKAPVVEAPDDAYVMPGLIDLHNHIAYNVLPLWDPGQSEPFTDHESWKQARTYRSNVIAPAQLWADAEPEALLAYVQVRAVVGGATAIQGWPKANRSHLRLLRKIDDEADAMPRINQSTWARSVPELIELGRAERNGVGFIYHCGEGLRGSPVATEFRDVVQTGCLRKGFMGVHCIAVEAEQWDLWPPRDSAVVWSPFSNYWLYKSTTRIREANARGVRICLGSDWAPSGTKNVLGELKVAKLTSDGAFDCRQLVEMVTTNPGDMLGLCWTRQAGRLTSGAYGDVLVLRGAGRKKDFWSDVIHATEADVALVVSDGEAKYGEAALMEQARAKCAAPIQVAATLDRVIAIPHPDDPKGETPWRWDEICKRLLDVTKGPEQAREKAAARVTGLAGFTGNGVPPLVLLLDMPDGGSAGVDGFASGGAAANAVAPVTPSTAPVFPKELPTLVHDQTFFDAVDAQKIHGGALSGLAAFYGAKSDAGHS